MTPAEVEEQELSGPAYLRLVLLGVVIGIPAALVAALFLAFVHEAEHWLWTDVPQHLGESSPPWYLVIFLPAIGGVLVAAARKFLPGDGGHNPLRGLDASPTPVAYAPSVFCAASATLIFGAVLGPEAPLIALGSATALLVTSFAKVGEKERKVLATAGSFSAISAIFGGPIVAGVLMLEAGIGLGRKLIPALIPGFVAAAIGYVVIVGFGSWGGLNVQSIQVTDLPVYQGFHLADLFLALCVGIVIALLVSVVRILGARVSGNEPRLGTDGLVILGGLLVGLIAQTAAWLGADSQNVLFSGQTAVPAVLAETSAKILIILLVAKALAYAVSLGSGFRGGPIFPAIFLGVALATLSVVWFDTSPTLAAAIGTAAGVAAGTRLILTSIVFAGLITGKAGIDAMPAVVIAAVAAWIVMTMLDRVQIGHKPPKTQPETA
jgi:H+/Cl- antiporter ClcA